ncbi:MAG: alpha/beta hydrolase [Limnohabitans sp.]|nr:alpha/beta hydrolase [Limnohabitans sp.]
MIMRRSYSSIPSGQVHYIEAGQGAPLLLLHSAPRSSRAFRFLIPQLEQHFRCIALDLPGFGESDPLEDNVTMESLGDGMIEFLASLGIVRAHVFGYHTGNKVAVAMAANHPHCIDRVILCGQIHSIIPDKVARNDAIRHIVDKYFTRYPSSSAGDEHLRRWVADWSDITGLGMPRSIFSKPKVTAQDITELKVRVLDHVQSLSSIEMTYSANFEFDFAECLKRITNPTLILELVMQDEEHYGRQLDALCQLNTNIRGATILNAGRVALESHTNELATHIKQFLTASD